MKKIIFLLFGFVLLISSCQKEPVAPVTPKPQPSNLDTRSGVLSELNYARTNPKEYAEVIRERRKAYKGNGLYTTLDGEEIYLIEGQALFDEAINALEKQEPLQPLVMSKGLNLTAQYLVDDIDTSGNPYGSKSFAERLAMFVDSINSSSLGENMVFETRNAREMVVQLILSDGTYIDNRKDIFSPKFKYVGIGLGNHKSFNFMCVIDYASNLTEKN